MRRTLHIGQGIGITLALFILPLISSGSDVSAPEAEGSRLSYSIGYQVGSDMMRQGVAIEPRVLLRGVRDALSGGEPLLPRPEMRDVLVSLSEQVARFEAAKVKEEAQKNLAAGLAFLSENGKKEGVSTLPSGLQYKVIRRGSGNHPRPGDTVTVHYRGTLIDGTEFDSSYSRGKPATFRDDHVIPGWKEALPLMETGSRWQLFVPPALGYGERRNGRIAPNSTLIFDVELLSSNPNEK